MQAHTRLWTVASGWDIPASPVPPGATLILAFGGGAALLQPGALRQLEEQYVGAVIAAASTAGEILGESVIDDSIVALVIYFATTRVRAAVVAIGDAESSDAIAARLAAEIELEGLAHVLVLSDGLLVNGSALARGLADRLPEGVAVTGGLAADGDRFERTYVGLGSDVSVGGVVAVALYGASLRVGFGSVGGWDSFGPERVVSRSAGNVLHTLDGEPALTVYKRYLGHAAADLPASALLFPLALSRDDGLPPVVRTILGIDEATGTMTFAGDVPQGAGVRLMRANFDRLIDGAELAASSARAHLTVPASVAILVSCVGRRLVLKQRIEDEIDGVRRVLGPAPVIAGFYSYGEITPVAPGEHCELHNQTMTITTLAEV
ncbi:MAG: FIST N-terminal domain-containing protein [Gemmatimonadota bacterium]